MISVQELVTESRQILNKNLPAKDAHDRMLSSKRPSPSEARQQNLNPRESAVLVLLYPGTNHWKSVLIERSGYNGVHSKQIAFPGGKKENSDSNLVQTALREAQEEVAINPESVDIVGNLSELYIPPSNFIVQPIVGISSIKPQFHPDPREVASVIEFDTRMLFDESIIKEKEIFLPNYNTHLNVKYFDIHGHVVWGATGMMLSEFSQIFKEVLA